MPKYRNRATGEIVNFDHEPSPQELAALGSSRQPSDLTLTISGKDIQQAAGPERPPQAPEGPSMGETAATDIGLPMAGGIIGGKVSGPIGSALGTTAGTAYGDLYKALKYGGTPSPTPPSLTESPWEARLRGFSEASGEEARKLAEVGAGTLAAELTIPPILKSIPAPSQMFGKARRGVAGLGELLSGAVMGHPGVGAGAAALEAAAPTGRAIEKAITPWGAAPERSTAWGAAKGEMSDIMDWLRGAKSVPIEPTSQTATAPVVKAAMGGASPVVETAGETAARMNKVPYGGSPTGPAPYRPAAKAAARADLAAEAARLKQAAADEARQQIQETIAASGYEPKPPTISETVSAPAGQGTPAQRMTTSYGPKPEAIDDILGGGAPQELRTPPPAPAPVAGPELAPGGPAGPVRTQGPYAYGNVGGQVSGVQVPIEPVGPTNWDDVAIANQARSDVAAGTKAAQTAQPPNAELATFFKTPGGAAGAAYGADKAAVAAGTLSPQDLQFSRASRLMTIPGREAEGAELLRSAAAAKPLSKVRTPSIAPEAPAPSTEGATTDWSVDYGSQLEAFKALNELFKRYMP